MSMQDALVWIDCEMTGLDVENCRILEIAVIVTDGQCEKIIEGPSLVIHQPPEILDSMNDWCKNQFGWRSVNDFDADNLGMQSLESKTTEAEADSVIVDFLKNTCSIPEGKAVLAGNTIHMDKRFIDKYLPQLSKFLHYRLVDVSTVKELVRRWMPDLVAPWKQSNHRALDDIKESINEMIWYKQKVFMRETSE
jgi:oligoribonuclease